MEELQRDIFIPEYNQLMRDKNYIELIEKCKTEQKNRRKETFWLYSNINSWHYVENQLYNEKNSAVEVLSILLEVKEEIENKIKSTWIKYLLEEIEERIKGHTEMIETQVWWLNNWLTMSVYTYTDIILRWANAYESIILFYENLKNSLKKEWENETTLTAVEEIL